jgi:hypothetical protein
MSNFPFLQNRKLAWNIFFVAVLFALFLGSCDPNNPLGIRMIGYYPSELSQSGKNELVGLLETWGPGGGTYVKSTDGGMTWQNPERKEIENHYQVNFYQTKFITGDCTYECEFLDYVNYQIHYRIREGKTLERSLDGGISWKAELSVPAWNPMQANYVKSLYLDTGLIPRDIRGPFDAITDPETGNLVVAMGYEGILVRQPGKDWEWIPVGEFKYIEMPTGWGMLFSQVYPSDWLRGIVFSLIIILIAVRSTQQVSGLEILRDAVFYPVLALYAICILPISSTCSNLYFAPSGSIGHGISIILPTFQILYIFFLVVVVVVVFRNNWDVVRKQLYPILGSSIFFIPCYWAPFLLLNYGIIFKNYQPAFWFSAGILFIFLIIAKNFSKILKLIGHRQTPSGHPQ